MCVCACLPGCNSQYMVSIYELTCISQCILKIFTVFSQPWYTVLTVKGDNGFKSHHYCNYNAVLSSV